MRLLWLLVPLSSLVAQPEWSADRVIQPSGSFNWAKAIAVSPKDRSIWVLATDQRAVPEADELWRLDADGQDRKTIAIAPKLDRFENVLGITDAGDVYLLGWVRERMHLVKIDSSGATSFVRPLEPGAAHPLGMVTILQRGLLLFGDRGSGAYASRIDEEGRKLWSIGIDKKPLAAIFEAGIALEGGSTILVGNVWDWKQGKIGMGLGNTLIVKVDPAGKIVQQKTFAGRIATAARAGDGNILVVDDPQILRRRCVAWDGRDGEARGIRSQLHASGELDSGSQARVEREAPGISRSVPYHADHAGCARRRDAVRVRTRIRVHRV